MSDPRPATLVTSLRKLGIADERVLSAIARTPRGAFVDQPFEASAFENTALPIACGQTISQPYVVAYMSEALELDPKHRVLEIGTGSGYQSAILSPLCRMVYTIERHKPLLAEAEARFKKLKLANIVTKHGDGFKGWPEAAPFDRIILTAVVESVPAILIEQLKPNGILVAPVGGPASAVGISQYLTKMIKNETGTKEQTLIPVVFVPMLPGVPAESNRADARDRKD
jgi:protein-L-isoaspartate(D-aspartate) O-methyltransferase